MKPGDSLPDGHMLDGRYRVSRVLGTGGMGRVYLANDSRLAKRPVAVKEMIIADGVQERKAIEDFARERNVLSKLSHPGIPSLYDYFVENARHYLVMEFVAGGDLQRMLDDAHGGSRMPEARVVYWARQILDVLDFLHSQKPPIIYRDIKPGNIMIDKSGRAMLIDFGIARFLPPGGRGTQIGSVGYAPPEQYTGKTEPRSDLYSLAATMHHLLTGRDPQLEPPFSFPPLRSLAPEVSPATANVVMAALDKDIDRRPADARAMLHALPEPPGDAAGLSPAPAASAHDGMTQSSSTASNARTIVLPAKDALASSPHQAQPDGKTVSGGGDIPARSLGGKPSSNALEAAAMAVRRVSAAVKAMRRVTPDTSGSSEAKTQELVGRGNSRRPYKRQPPPGHNPAVQRSLSPIVRSRPVASKSGPAVSASGLAEPELDRAQAIESAWLIAHGIRFGIARARTIIGRSVNGSGGVDIDLLRLGQAADRVSQRHAEVIKRGADYFIRDLGSLNGTYITGRGRLGRDQLYRLRDHDQVVLGATRLEFRKA